MKHKTHNPLLKPFTLCTIFAWFGIYKGFPDWVITPLLTLFACWPVSSVKYCKCYLFLDDSPRSSSCQISFNTPTMSSTHCFTPAVDDFKTCIVHSLKSCPVRYTQTLPAGCHPPEKDMVTLAPSRGVCGQTNPSWNTALLAWLTSAALVGGMLARLLGFFITVLTFSWRLWGCLLCHKNDSQTSQGLHGFLTDIFGWDCQCSETSCQFGNPTLAQYCILLWRGTCIGDPDDLAWPSDVEPVCARRLCRSFPVP